MHVCVGLFVDRGTGIGRRGRSVVGGAWLAG
jgi:hypothetical protein